MNVLRLGAIALAAILVATAGSADARTHRKHHKHAVKNPHAHTAVMHAGGLPETQIPVDSIITVDGMEVGCTGIGLEAREEARWKRFTTRVEFSGSYNQYIPGGRLVVKTWEGKKPLVNVRCDAPWILLDLEPGKYRVAGVMEGYSQPQSWIMRLKPNRKKTRRIVLHFDEVTGSDP